MATDSTPHQPVNHVFADLENVRTIDPDVVGGKNLTFHLFYGPQNQKLDLKVVEALVEHVPVVKIIRTRVVVKNGLDFVLAYHLGQAVMADPKGYFHIVAKDTGYDALVDLLKTKHVKVRRHASWSELNFNVLPKVAVQSEPAAQEKLPAEAKAKAPAAKALSAEAEKLLENHKKAVKNRPVRKKTLVNHAKAFLGKKATDEMGEKVIGELQKAGHLVINDKGAVSYML